MTRIALLEELRGETVKAVKDLLLPVRRQKEDAQPPPNRAAAVYLMRLPDSTAAQKKAPYIIHQVITGKDVQPEGLREQATAVVRSIFCVYHDDEEEGGLALLTLMERQRIHLLKNIVIRKRFQIDVHTGIETLIYPDDTAPYYTGEMISAWTLPRVEREVQFYGKDQNTGLHS
jgi:hypothetical protein